MPVLQYVTRLKCTQQELWDFHSSVEALEKLSPPGTKVTVLSQDNRVRNGNVHVLQIKQGPFMFGWEALLSDVQEPFGFTDTAQKSIFPAWKHRHIFEATEEGCLLRDIVELSPPWWVFGEIGFPLLMKFMIDDMFRHRHAVTKKILESRNHA